MHRIHFFILTGLSSLVFLLVVANIFLAHKVNILTNTTAAAQSDISQAQVFQNNLQQLAMRVYSDAQKSQDAGLKEIVSREQINFTPAPGSSTSGESTTPASTK